MEEVSLNLYNFLLLLLFILLLLLLLHSIVLWTHTPDYTCLLTVASWLIYRDSSAKKTKQMFFVKNNGKGKCFIFLNVVRKMDKNEL